MPLFDFDHDSTPKSKMHVHMGLLPPYIDPKQPSTKKQPWRAINDAPFLSSVSMIMPAELYATIWDKLDASLKRLQYAKVILKLEHLLQGDFFTEYIKRGDVIMLSEGRPGVDNLFSLRDGVLRLDLDKESYERTGLQGSPTRNGGRRHIKARFGLELDLRQPSMLHGKKGFERIVWAAKNVLNHSLVWLFCNLSSGAPSIPAPIDQHHPTIVEGMQKTRTLKDSIIPDFHAILGGVEAALEYDATTEETLHELPEWFAMVSLESPRLHDQDTIDPYLSRYEVPESNSGSEVLKIVRWSGLMGAGWLTQLLVACM